MTSMERGLVPAALLEATADLIAAGPTQSEQLEAGLAGLMYLVDADRGDAGWLTKNSRTYRPAQLASRDAVDAVSFEVPASDPIVTGVLKSERAAFVRDIRSDLPSGPVRDVLVGSRTRSILVRRLEHLSDGCGLVCLDWIDHDVVLDNEAVELVDFFVTRIWSPLLSRAAGSTRRCADPLAPLSAAERSVAELSARGLSYGEIAQRRQTSINTVSQQLRSARRKVGARNTRELCSMIGDTHCHGQ